MSIISGKSRLSHHTLTTAGATFSVPTQEDFTIVGASGSWVAGDLALSEIGVNEGDGTAFIRIGGVVSKIMLSTSGGTSSLSPSLPVFTNASNNLTSNTMTGTGSVVMNTSPTIYSPSLTGIPTTPNPSTGVTSSQVVNAYWVDTNFNKKNLLWYNNTVTATMSTVETIVAGGAGFVTFKAGDVFRITVSGVCTSTNADTVTFKMRIGSTGTTADPIAAEYSFTSTATGVEVPFRFDVMAQISTFAVSGVLQGRGIMYNATGGITANPLTLVVESPLNTVDTTGLGYVTLSYVSSAVTTYVKFEPIRSIERTQL